MFAHSRGKIVVKTCFAPACAVGASAAQAGLGVKLKQAGFSYFRHFARGSCMPEFPPLESPGATSHMDLQDQVRQLPSAPGVYLFRDAEDRVLYVGKAKSLRARLRNYFLEARLAEAKTGSLLREAARIDTILTANEGEALALENNLIKTHRPRFNVLLRDDKTYPYICMTRERFPRVYVTRRLGRKDAEYFGPYCPASRAWRVLRFIHKLFRIPSCSVDLTRNHAQPCLQFHIQRCLGPCVTGLTTEEVYARAAADARLFLAGKTEELARQLARRRDAAAAAQQYETAAALHDLASVVQSMRERQQMAAVEGRDADLIGFYRQGDRAALNRFHLRSGRVVEREEYFWEDLPQEEFPGGDASPDVSVHGARQSERQLSEEDVSVATATAADPLLAALLKQLYWPPAPAPSRALIPEDFEDRPALETVVAASSGHRLSFQVPRRGASRRLVEWAQANARHSYDRHFEAQTEAARLEAELRQTLNLPAAPVRIECFDISHFQGAETVASMVVWEKGRMRKSGYRSYIVRGLQNGEIDDFRAMSEAVGRRYRRLLAESAVLPGLVLIDGGVGQLHAAQAALRELGLASLPIASLAKREELLFIPGREQQPIRLASHSPVLHLVQQIRDEAHRFALRHHRGRRQRRGLQSELLLVPGIGHATARKLLLRFGSLTAIQQASAAELRECLNRRQIAALRPALPGPIAAPHAVTGVILESNLLGDRKAAGSRVDEESVGSSGLPSAGLNARMQSKA